MTTRHIIELEVVPFIIIAAFLSTFLVWQSNKNIQEQFHVSLPILAENKTQTVISPTFNPILKIDSASQVSPDGSKKLVMKTTHNTDGTLTYLFTTTDGLGTNEQQLYTTKIKRPENMSVPFNAWSPDNKYVFIKKNDNDALIFKATGEPIASGEAYLTVLDVFTERIKKDTISDVTGWASPTLLIINTTTLENTKGSSYWFEVPSKAIIQLASQF